MEIDRERVGERPWERDRGVWLKGMRVQQD